jgi:hypothetical protein
MSTRYLAALAACLGVAGVLSAQPVADTPRPLLPFPGARANDYSRPVAQVAPDGYLPAPSAGADGTPPQVAPAPRPVEASPAEFVPVLPSECPAPCEPVCAPCDCLCGPPGRVWVSAEWLYWATAGQSLPPLVTTAPPGTPRGVAGTVGGPGTVVLFGDHRANNDFRNGFRVNAGTWLDECQRCGIEGNFFFLQPSREHFAAGSNGTAIVTRPFFNALTGRPDTELVSFPGIVAGAVAADTESRLIGGGANFVKNCCCSCCARLDLLVGFRYLNLRDDLTVREDLTTLAGSGLPAGTRFVIVDHFHTDNDFYGVPVGFAWERRLGNFFVGTRASVAMGVVHQTVTIDGSTVIAPPGGPPVVSPGGLLAQPTNIGRYTSDRFAVVPEVGVRLGVQATERLRAFVGYDFLYWSNVVRAGDQVDLRVNTNQIAPPRPLAGPAVPAFAPVRTDYWAQGIGVGAEYRY